MSEKNFLFDRVATATVKSTVGEVFAVLDDHKRLAAHMEKPSLMMGLQQHGCLCPEALVNFELEQVAGFNWNYSNLR